MARTYSNQFPDFVLDVIVPSDFRDNSWCNDVCPSFYGHGLRLWIDYKEPERREMQNKRFIIQREDDEGQLSDEVLLETDDWNEVIAKIAELTPYIPRH